MKKIIVIVAVVVVLGIAGAAFFLLMGGNDEDAPEPVIRVPHHIGLFTSNVRNASGFFRIEITVVANSEDDSVALLLAEEHARVRHTILFLLRAMTAEDFQAPDAQIPLATRILHALNDELEVTYFVEVLFTEYVIG